MHTRILSFISILALGATLVAQQDTANTLDILTVTSAPLGGALDEQAQPVSILEGDKLKLNLANSLGETLAREPGVSSTSYGPGASRPIIRGIDGDRIKILQNGTATLDASAASVDHAVSVRPINVSRIEIVRGPASLLYGTSAVGGVVNVIDNRIPTEPVLAPISGATDLRYGSANGVRAGAISLDGGEGAWAFHLDGFKRNSHNLAIPGEQRSSYLRKAEPLAKGEEEVRDTLPNSALDEQGATVGAAYVTAKGYIGGSYSGSNSNYGTVGEPQVAIGLRQQRFDFAGGINEPFEAIQSIKFKLGVSDYQHIEYEGANPGTKFENEGYDGRIDVVQKKIGRLEGAWGIETQKIDFSALGAEAFLPPTETLIHSVFAFEKLDFKPVSLEIGGRYDRSSVKADSNPVFGPARERKFDTFGLSAGLVWQVNPTYTVALSTAYTERAPNYLELFAKGPHLATLAYEVGDPNLGTEKSTGIDLSFRKNSGRVKGAVTLFYNHFDDFIAQIPNGFVDFEGEPLALQVYRATEAVFYGGEFEATVHLHDVPDALDETGSVSDGKSTKNVALNEAIQTPTYLDLVLRSDYVHAQDESADEPLPRIPPWRIGGGLVFQHGPVSARVDVDHNFKQDRQSVGEFPTDGYTLVSASVSYRFNTGPLTSTVFIKGTNLLNEEARNSTSFLKEVAPLAGRGIEIGWQAAF